MGYRVFRLEALTYFPISKRP